MKKISLIKLFLIFVKIGAILLGGGYVILPILRNEFIERRSLINDDDLMDYFALSQTLPGIIAANISMFIGYKLHGKLGAIISMFGVIFVPFFTIILLASVLNMFTENSIINNVFWGINVAVIALIMLTIREMWQKSEKNTFFCLLFSLSLLTLLLTELSPFKVILIFHLIFYTLYLLLFFNRLIQPVNFSCSLCL